MNISHLINKKVTVFHNTENGVMTVMCGRLCRSSEDGYFFVFNDSLFTFILKMFIKKKKGAVKEYFMRFHWSSVSECVDDVIHIFEYSEETIQKLLKEYEQKETL